MVGMMERFDKLEFEEDARGFKLKETIINSWFRFAEALRGAAFLLWSKLEDPPMKVLSPFTRPERYGYMFTHASREEAIQRANES